MTDNVTDGSGARLEFRNQNGSAGERLDSWKEIARYLNRSVRTLYRWEKEEGLPVHRHQHRELGSVFAYTAELDAWLNARRPDADRPAEDHQTAGPRRPTLAVALALVTVAAVVIGSTFYISSRGHTATESDVPFTSPLSN